MTSTVVPVVPGPRQSPEAAAPVPRPDRDGAVRTPRPVSQYWDVSEARWHTAR